MFKKKKIKLIPHKTNINQKLRQNFTLHCEGPHKQNPNTHHLLLTPKLLQKTITPTKTPLTTAHHLLITRNITSPSHHLSWAKFPHSFIFHHQSILGMSEKIPKQAKQLQSRNWLSISNQNRFYCSFEHSFYP